jgi:hypothetical protein
MMKRIIVALCLLLLMPLSAWSDDIVATWQNGDGNPMKLAMRDENHIRMDMGTDSYMLLSGQKVYTVSRQDSQWNVMDMGQLASAMKRYGTLPAAMNQKENHYQTDFRRTGRTETIAGYKGSVYVVETKDASGRVINSGEVVFSKNKDIKRINKAWLVLASRARDMIGLKAPKDVAAATQKAEKSGYGGALRIDDLKLVKVEKPTLSASYFELPAGAKMKDVMAAPATNGAKSDQGQSDNSNYATDLGKKAGNAAQEEVQQDTVDQVKKGVGDLFKKLFK